MFLFFRSRWESSQLFQSSKSRMDSQPVALASYLPVYLEWRIYRQYKWKHDNQWPKLTQVTSKLKNFILILTQKCATYYLITLYRPTSLWQTSQKCHLERSHLEKWHLETASHQNRSPFSKCHPVSKWLLSKCTDFFPSGLSKWTIPSLHQTSSSLETIMASF